MGILSVSSLMSKAHEGVPNCTWKVWEFHCVFLFYELNQQHRQGNRSEFLSFQMTGARANSWVTLYTVDYVMFALAWLKLNTVSVTQRQKWAVRPTHIFLMLMRVTSADGTGWIFGVTLGEPPSQWREPTCKCLRQMYFLMKVWGQRVPSQG